ncbi:MAG TPA: HEAT repeat domain-containing protein [Anaerolineales bacterium]
MDTPVMSNISKTTDCMDDIPYTDIPGLIKKLGDVDGFICMHAREILICIGKPAVAALIDILSDDNSQMRWQAIKVLESIQDNRAAPALVARLKDENAGVRWAASDALIALRRAAIPVLLESLVCDLDSLWLRQGAHHILHVLKDSGKLSQAEEKVFEALEDVEPSVAVPWAAEKAIESLRNRKK